MRFDQGRASQRDLLGGKGANLAEMTNIGLPVPPGFTITTDACQAFLRSGDTPDGLWDEVESGPQQTSRPRIGRRFGDPADPLLLSVRSGAKFSMPGMMDTVLDLGLNDRSSLAWRPGTASASPSTPTAASCRCSARWCSASTPIFSSMRSPTAKQTAGVQFDHELSADDLKALVTRFKEIVADEGEAFPEDPWEQLRMAVLAVFRSWNTPRAQAYRRSNRISEDPRHRGQRAGDGLREHRPGLRARAWPSLGIPAPASACSSGNILSMRRVKMSSPASVRRSRWRRWRTTRSFDAAYARALRDRASCSKRTTPICRMSSSRSSAAALDAADPHRQTDRAGCRPDRGRYGRTRG